MMISPSYISISVIGDEIKVDNHNEVKRLEEKINGMKYIYVSTFILLFINIIATIVSKIL